MKYILTCLICIFAASAPAQQEQGHQTPTIIFLTRHAEKDVNEKSNDPGLDSTGTQRSLRLATHLKDAGIHAVYATVTKRASLTAKPLADSLKLPLITYGNDLVKETRDFIAKHTGQHILVVGHSNTVPAMLNLFAGKDLYHPNDEYGALFLVILLGDKLHDIVQLNY